MLSLLPILQKHISVMTDPSIYIFIYHFIELQICTGIFQSSQSFSKLMSIIVCAADFIIHAAPLPSSLRKYIFSTD